MIKRLLLERDRKRANKAVNRSRTNVSNLLTLFPEPKDEVDPSQSNVTATCPFDSADFERASTCSLHSAQDIALMPDIRSFVLHSAAADADKREAILEAIRGVSLAETTCALTIKDHLLGSVTRIADGSASSPGPFVREFVRKLSIWATLTVPEAARPAPGFRLTHAQIPEPIAILAQDIAKLFFSPQAVEAAESQDLTQTTKSDVLASVNLVKLAEKLKELELAMSTAATSCSV